MLSERQSSNPYHYGPKSMSKSLRARPIDFCLDEYGDLGHAE